MLIYCCVAYLINAVCIVIFKSELCFTSLSFIPAFLILLTVFQAFYFKNEKIEEGFQTAHGSVFTAEEQNEMRGFMARSFFIIMPLMLPFVFFFHSGIKLFSLLVYIAGYMAGPIIYQVKNKDKINARLKQEEMQRKEQEQKEELGRFK